MPTAKQIKIVCLRLCGGVLAAQRQMRTQVPIEFCMLVINIGIKIYPFFRKGKDVKERSGSWCIGRLLCV